MPDQNTPLIFTGNANRPLAEAICEYLDMPLGDATVTPFPNGETFVKINQNIRGRDVFIVQPTCPPTNHNLMELLIMIDAAKRASAKRITAVVPFYGYARQDRKDQPRVPITAKLVANLITSAGATRLLCMDLHAQQIQGFFDIPVDHLYALPVMYGYIKSKNLPNPVVVSPDVGGMKMANAYAQMLHCDLALITKRRLSATEVETQHLVGEVEGKDVLLVDDLTETGGTLAKAAEVCKQNGASSVNVCVSHALIGDIARERLKGSSIDELVTTDSTPVQEFDGFKMTVLTVSGILGEAIKRIYCGESVTSLFEINGNALKT